MYHNLIENMYMVCNELHQEWQYAIAAQITFFGMHSQNIPISVYWH